MSHTVFIDAQWDTSLSCRLTLPAFGRHIRRR